MPRISPARVVAACAAALFVPLFVPLLSGRVFTYDDLSSFHVPTRWLYARALSAGDAIWWMPDLMSGFYLHGEGQVGMLHPLHLMLYAGLPFTLAFTLDIVSNYVFAAAGTIVMLRRWGCSWAASGLGAIVYAFSGFNLTHLIHINAVAVAAHLPWLMAAAHAIVSSPTSRQRLRGAIAMAVLLGSAFLMGFPQCLLLSAIAIGFFLLWQMWTSRDVSAVGWLAMAAFAGLALGAVQVLPTIDVAAESFRRQVGTEFATSFSLHPYNLLQLVAPYVFPNRVYFLPGEHSIHESTLYAGALGTLAVVYALVRGRSITHSALVRWALALGAGALVLALGRHTPVYPLLAELPLLGSFRAPGRFILLVHFAMAIVSAAVFDDLLASIKEQPPRRATIVGALAATVLLTAAVSVGSVMLTDGGIGRSVESLIAFASVGILLVLALRGRRRALALLPVVVAIDLGAWGYSYLWTERPASPIEIAARADRPPAPPGSLVYLPDVSNTLVLAGYRVLNVYVALTPRRAVEVEDPLAHRLAGAEWRKIDRRWEPVPEPMPRARLVHQVSVARRQIGRAVFESSIELSAVVQRPLALDLARDADDVRVLVDRPGRMTMTIRTSGRGVLVTTERYHEGWRGRTADGRILPVVRVNGDYLGCVVDAGPTEVTLTFDPQSLRVGVWVSAAALLAIALASAMAWVPAIRRP